MEHMGHPTSSFDSHRLFFKSAAPLKSPRHRHLRIASGKRLNNELERSTIFHGKTQYKWVHPLFLWPFSR